MVKLLKTSNILFNYFCNKNVMGVKIKAEYYNSQTSKEFIFPLQYHQKL
jgi:hypothetical protein